MVDKQIFGAERSFLEMLAAVDRRRYRLSCVLPAADEGYLRLAAEYTSNVEVLPYRWWNAASPACEQEISLFEAFLSKSRADLVHVNTITVMAPILAARRLGLPSIVHARELINRNHQVAALLGGPPSKIAAIVREASDFIIANSDATHRLYYKPGKSFRLYNSVDLARFDIPRSPPTSSLKVGMLSNNGQTKGILQFIRLAAMASDHQAPLEFLAFGPQTDHVSCLRAAFPREAANVCFLDYVSDPADAIRQLDVLASLSLVAESFGRTIAEAMAARRPVLAYDHGAAGELVRHGEDGFLIPYLDYSKGLEHLEMLARHPEQLRQLGDNARQRAEDLFAPSAFAAELNRIYSWILSSATRLQGTETFSRSSSRQRAPMRKLSHVDAAQNPDS